MTETPDKPTPPIHDRIHEEMLDSFDEELELESDDDRLDTLTNEFSGQSDNRPAHLLQGTIPPAGRVGGVAGCE